mgnify:CR=1 FL=1
MTMHGLLPAGFNNWNPAFRGAFLKGYRAHQTGAALTDCPYADCRKSSGGLTWSRAFRSAWRDGWDWSRKHPVPGMQEC